VGIGKLYWPNGKLKYEWHLTRRDPIGYKKSYNKEGELRHAVFYDEFNNQIERQQPTP
jgi:antitoxin component YwqK of YwqJK toxin-antitoxin module